MSRKHYRALAEALKTANAPYDVVLAVANVCKQDNSRFDYSTFFNAVGINY